MCAQSSVMSDSLWPHELQSPPGSCAQGIFQARILEWGAISSTRGYSRPRDRTHSLTLVQAGIWLIIIQNTNKKTAQTKTIFIRTLRMPMTNVNKVHGYLLILSPFEQRAEHQKQSRETVYIWNVTDLTAIYFSHDYWRKLEIVHAHTHAHTHIYTSNLALHSTFCNHKYRSRTR